MAKKKSNDKKKSKAEIIFEKELKKLKLSAERGIPFLGEKKDEPDSLDEEAFWEGMQAFEAAMRNPKKVPEEKIRDLLKFTDFPMEEDLSDDEVSAALELVNTALAHQNIVLDVIHPTPEREIYRFITEELLNENLFPPFGGGMTTHFIYEEFHPNHIEEIKADAIDILHYICRGHKGHLPWRIAYKVRLHGEEVTQEEFIALLTSHREVFQGMSFIGVDTVDIDFNGPKAQAKVSFRYYLDQSSGTPGENSAEAKIYLELDTENQYCLTRLVIKQFGIE